MNRWFSFQFKGKDFIGIWLVYWLIFIAALSFLIFDLVSTIVPLGIFEKNADPSQIDESNAMVIAKFALRFVLIIFFIVIWEFIFYYYLIKNIISNFGLEENICATNYHLGKLFGIVVLGCFLTVITCWIYFPWFKKKIISYFIDNAQYKDAPFKFHGEGIILFAIFALCLVLPSLIMLFLQIIIYGPKEQPSLVFQIISNTISIILSAFYIVLFIFWLINISIRNYVITTKENYVKTILYVIGQYCLGIITLGIYFPLAELKVYKYFMSQITIKEQGKVVYTANFDLDSNKDFISLWLEILLTIITLGIYFPWFIENVLKLVVNKTYLIPVHEETDQRAEITV